MQDLGTDRNQIASKPDSPVRIRMASSMLETKIFPSPMRPVWAARRIASTAFSTMSSPSTISIFTLGRKIHDVFGSAIKLGMAFLPSKPLGFGDGDALQADLLQCLLHFVELEWLDDRFDLLHSVSFPLACPHALDLTQRQGLAELWFSRLHANGLEGRKPAADQILNSRLMTRPEDI